MSTYTYKLNITTIRRLVIYQSFIRKRYFINLVYDRLLYIYKVYLIFYYYFDLKF